MDTTQTADRLLDLTGRSGLLPPDRLDRYRDLDPPGDPARPPADRLADLMVRDRVLTAFQAAQLLRGRCRGFFLTDKYKILELIGAGGMGKVVLCEHLILHRLVAVKLLGGHGKTAPEDRAVERFYREARAVAALDHRNIVRVFDIDTANGSPFMVMEYVDGADLHKLVAAAGPLPVAHAGEYARQAAFGLQHAHEAGLVHRDIKPGNILVDRAGTVKLLDLGLARFLGDLRKNQALTERYDNQAILGTADFMAPEQTADSSRADTRSDIYSLGCTLFYLLTGRMVWEDGSFAQKLIWHQTRVPPSVRAVRPDVPEGVAGVVARMLEKRPEDRFQTPGEVAEVLARWASPRPVPPAAAVLPKVTPGTYPLGLSPMPPPSARLGGSGPTSSPRTGPSSRVIGPPSRRAGPPTTPPRSMAATRPNPIAAPAPPSSVPAADVPAAPPRRPSRQVVLAAAAAVLAVATAGWSVWNSLGSGRRPTEPDPEPRLPVAQKTEPPADPKPGPDAPPGKTPPGPAPAGVPSKGIALKAGGSTFVDPVMQHWTGLYARQHGVAVGYGGGGSGKGVQGVIDGSLDFGCTDAPMTDDELAKAKAAGRDVVHVPLVMGAVVPTYNLPGVGGGLKFTGPVLADIYLGKITFWDDEAIRINNPGAKLPHKEIAVVHRGDDKSGTTFIWTDYLAKVSGEWRDGPGRGTTVRWPTGVAVKGSDGVSAKVSQTVGAVGYVELTFAKKKNLPAGAVQNQDGEFVAPSFGSVTAAAEASHERFPEDLRFTFTDAPGKDSYPIGGATWALLPLKDGKPNPDTVLFLEWATHEGQEHAPGLLYAPLPKGVRDRLDLIFYRLKRVR